MLRVTMMRRMGNEQDIAAIAHWVEQHRGREGARYIAEQIGRFASRGDEDCARLWRGVGDQFARLGLTAVSA